MNLELVRSLREFAEMFGYDRMVDFRFEMSEDVKNIAQEKYISQISDDLINKLDPIEAENLRALIVLMICAPRSQKVYERIYDHFLREYPNEELQDVVHRIVKNERCKIYVHEEAEKILQENGDEIMKEIMESQKNGSI